MKGSKRLEQNSKDDALHKVGKNQNNIKACKSWPRVKTTKKNLKTKRSKSIQTYELREGRWFLSEHLRLIKGILLFANAWSRVRDVVRTRSTNQIRSHTQKYLLNIIRNSNCCDESQFDTLSKIICYYIYSISQSKRSCRHQPENDSKN